MPLPQEALIQALDCGKDLESVQRLLRKHEELEREVHPIQAQVEVRSWLWSWAQGTSSGGPWAEAGRRGYGMPGWPRAPLPQRLTPASPTVPRA